MEDPNRQTLNSSGTATNNADPLQEDQTSSALLEKIKQTAEKLQDKFSLQSISATGPAKIFNPTSIRMGVRWRRDDEPGGFGSADGSDIALLWRSRDNRKGRNSIAVPRASSVAVSNSTSYPAFQQPQRRTSHFREVAKNLRRMCTTFPYWDMAFWVAFGYTLGSAIWVINGCFAWIPVAYPQTEFPGEVKYGVGITSFLGVLCFEFPAVIAYLEAVNEGSFSGSAMRRFLGGREDQQKALVDAKLHALFGHLWPTPQKDRAMEHAEALANAVDPEAGWATRDRKERPGSIYPPGMAPAPRRGAMDFGIEQGETTDYSAFRWLPTWMNFKNHYVYDIGFLACTIQLIGATIFMITGIVALPGILDSLEHWQENACYWIPQMVASACFITASLLFTLETQERWWKPQPNVLGWWIGMWALVGSIGFE